MAALIPMEQGFVRFPSRPGGTVITERALELCRFPAGARLLDVGCGGGATVRHVRARHALTIYGLDCRWRELDGSGSFFCASAEHLPIADAAMDGVMMECSFSAMEDPDAVLRECRRVLKPAGRLILSDVYARGQSARWKGCLARLETRETLVSTLTAHRWVVDRFQDFSEHLRALWGQMVLEKGLAGFCSEWGADAAALREVKCGYCLIIARREDA